MGVLVLLVLLFTQLLNSAATVTILGHKQMDADSEAREVLDRMAIDFAQMVKRQMSIIIVKASGIASDCGACGNKAGNDQIAFYSAVPGYYRHRLRRHPATRKSPISLLSLSGKFNTAFSSYNKMERMGKGLAWNGFPRLERRGLFSAAARSSETGRGEFSAVPDSQHSCSYEVIGPQVFRFEYYYLLTNRWTDVIPLSPWDTISGHTNISGCVSLQRSSRTSR